MTYSSQESHTVKLVFYILLADVISITLRQIYFSIK